MNTETQRYTYRLAKYSGRTGKLLKATPCSDWPELCALYVKHRRDVLYSDTYVRMECRRAESNEWSKLAHPLYG